MDLSAFAQTNQALTKREIERRGTLFLLEKMMGKIVTLRYNTDGKPFLENETVHFSLSHSYDRLVVLLNSEHPTGVDIEKIRDKVLNIKSRFLAPAELSDAGEDCVKLIVYWSAKEALFKVFGRHHVDFTQHFFVHPFERQEQGSLTGEIRLESIQKKYNMIYEKMLDYVLVYVIDEL
jgi:phosphopantetheinyl transferase